MPEHQTYTLVLILVGALAYLVGSVPFGLVITRALGMGDLRQVGSGNIGATNVLRMGNRWAALATLILDAGKGGVAVLIARAACGAEDAAQVAGVAAFLGHVYPAYLRFRGGKGVATLLGTLLALVWPVGIAACATWAAVAAATRLSSLAALAAAASVTAWMAAFGRDEALAAGALFTLIVVWRHRANIARLLEGTEPRIGKGR